MRYKRFIIPHWGLTSQQLYCVLRHVFSFSRPLMGAALSTRYYVLNTHCCAISLRERERIDSAALMNVTSSCLSFRTLALTL